MLGLEERLRAAFASVAVLAVALPVAAAGTEPPWQRLEFRAKKLFLTADAAVEFDPAVKLPANHHCDGKPSMPAAAARIRIESSMFGRRSRSSLWFDPGNLRAHLRVQEDRGSRNRYKSYAFCSGGVEAERATPKAGEAGLPAADWSHRYLIHHEVPSRLEAPLSEPSALLHLVGRLAGQPAGPGAQATWTVPVFSNNRILKVRLERDPVAVPAASEFSVAGRASPEALTLIRFTMTPVAIGAEGSAEDFELLGLEGAIEILAAKELQLPVSISGRLPPAGRVTVRLRHVVLRGGGHER